jgi:hypothetical protein
MCRHSPPLAPSPTTLAEQRAEHETFAVVLVQHAQRGCRLSVRQRDPVCLGAVSYLVYDSG